MIIAVHTDGPSPHLFPLYEAWLAAGDDVRLLLEWRVGRFGDPAVTGVPAERMAWLRDHHRGRRRPFTALRRIRALRDLLDDADVLVLGSYANLTAQLLLRMARTREVPVVLHLERPSPAVPTLLGRFRAVARAQVIRRTLRASASVWPMSARGHDEYEVLGGRMGPTIPYPIDADAWVGADDGDSTDGHPTDPVSVVVLGGLHARKRPVLALEAVASAARTAGPVTAIFVGAGPLAPAVAERARELDLSVSLVGQLDSLQVRRVLRAAGVLLHPAANDGWGMAVVEAAVSGCLVVASSATDAAVEVKRLSDTVLVVDGGSDAFGDALAIALERARRESRADRAPAVRRILAHHSPERLGDLSRSDLRRLVAPDGEANR